MRIGPNETVLLGEWLQRDGRVVQDEVTLRIWSLVKSHLVLLGSSPDGWDKLYVDPNDLRLWELTLPQSEMQGGGPPRLENLSITAARSKYGDAVVASAGSAKRKGWLSRLFSWG